MKEITFFTEWSKPGETPFAKMLYDHSIDYDENISISEAIENNELIDELSEKLHLRWGKEYDRPIIE